VLRRAIKKEIVGSPSRSARSNSWEFWWNGGIVDRGIEGRRLSPQSFDRLLRNELYAGWICLPKWKLKERGIFEPLVTEEQFQRVQDILDGRRISVTVQKRNNPDFPLRVFVSCGECSTPLTGAWSTGRRSRYPYYRCRNSKCKAVNVRGEKMESDFAALVSNLTPNASYMRLFQ
jgi:site-specific DNA recombinase